MRFLWSLSIGLLIAAPLRADPITTTFATRSAFEAAAGPLTTLDFEGIAPRGGDLFFTSRTFENATFSSEEAFLIDQGLSRDASYHASDYFEWQNQERLLQVQFA